jgi:hypothetical protein
VFTKPLKSWAASCVFDVRFVIVNSIDFMHLSCLSHRLKRLIWSVSSSGPNEIGKSFVLHFLVNAANSARQLLLFALPSAASSKARVLT